MRLVRRSRTVIVLVVRRLDDQYPYNNCRFINICRGVSCGHKYRLFARRIREREREKERRATIYRLILGLIRLTYYKSLRGFLSCLCNFFVFISVRMERRKAPCVVSQNKCGVGVALARLKCIRSRASKYFLLLHSCFLSIVPPIRRLHTIKPRRISVARSPADLLYIAQVFVAIEPAS